MIPPRETIMEKRSHPKIYHVFTVTWTWLEFCISIPSNSFQSWEGMYRIKKGKDSNDVLFFKRGDTRWNEISIEREKRREKEVGNVFSWNEKRRGGAHLLVETWYRSTRGRKGERKKRRGLQVLHIHLERKAGMGPMKSRLTFGKQPEKFVSTCAEYRARETISIRGGTIGWSRWGRISTRGEGVVICCYEWCSKQWMVGRILEKFLSFLFSRNVLREKSFNELYCVFFRLVQQNLKKDGKDSLVFCEV